MLKNVNSNKILVYLFGNTHIRAVSLYKDKLLRI